MSGRGMIWIWTKCTTATLALLTLDGPLMDHLRIWIHIRTDRIASTDLSLFTMASSLTTRTSNNSWWGTAWWMVDFIFYLFFSRSSRSGEPRVWIWVWNWHGNNCQTVEASPREQPFAFIPWISGTGSSTIGRCICSGHKVRSLSWTVGCNSSRITTFGWDKNETLGRWSHSNYLRCFF